MDNIDLNLVYGLLVYGGIAYVANLVSQKVNTKPVFDTVGKTLMGLPRMVMMVLMAVPEQLVLAYLEPELPLLNRLMVSVAMYTIHFAWNGMVMKPEKAYNELVWILGTALYAYHVVGVSEETAAALVAADSVMTLALRSLA